MKLQDVFLKAIARKISWPDAAEIAGLSYGTIHRIRQKYEEHGYDGIFGQTSRKREFYRVPLATVERVLTLYQEKYSKSSPREFHQKLKKRHGIEVNYGWLEQALRGAGLIVERRRHAPRSQSAIR